MRILPLQVEHLRGEPIAAIVRPVEIAPALERSENAVDGGLGKRDRARKIGERICRFPRFQISRISSVLCKTRTPEASGAGRGMAAAFMLVHIVNHANSLCVTCLKSPHGIEHQGVAWRSHQLDRLAWCNHIGYTSGRGDQRSPP